MTQINNKKEISHKKLEIFNGVIQVKSNKIRYERYMIKHTGKNNHIANVKFSVQQGGENVISRIYFYVFTESQFFNWFCNKRFSQNLAFFENKNNSMYYVDNHKGTIKLPIKDDTIIYVRMNNIYITTIPKKISLNIIEEWDEEKPTLDVVTTMPPYDESLKEGIEEMINTSQENLMIISPYMDMTLIKSLIEKKKEGVNVQIILRQDKQIKGLSKDGMNQIRKNFPESHMLRHNIHSRVVIRDDVEVLISSADLTQQSLQNQLNLGIKTSDLKIVEKSKIFFQKIWQESKQI